MSLPKGKRKKKPEIAKRMSDGQYVTPSGERLYTSVDVELMRMEDRKRYSNIASDYADRVELLVMRQIMLMNYYIRMAYEGYGKEEIKTYSDRLVEMEGYLRSNALDPDTGCSYTDMVYALRDELGVDPSIWQVVLDEESKR